VATLVEAIEILNRLAWQLRYRRIDVDLMECAYRGEHSLQFASRDFSTFFENRYDKFSDNWCGIVADAPHERLEVTGIRLNGQDSGDQGLWDVWRGNDADALSDLAFLDAIIAKRSYALVWADGDGNPSITWEHPSQAIVSYDPETRRRLAGAKVWADEKLEYATLYLPNEVWKFQRPRLALNVTVPAGMYVPSLDGGWKLREGLDKNPIPNPLGVVPLVELPNRPRLIGEPHSDIAGTLAMQHAINLLWSYLFAAADEATLGQRVIIGGEMPTVPILDENGEQVGERPIDLAAFSRKRALWLEDPQSKIDQWDAAKLDVYTNIIEIAVGHIAAQTRTPSHYLLIGGTIANVSSDAMKALETGLVKRTQEKTQHFGRAIRDVFELIALVQDDKGKAAAVRGGIVLWKDVENRSDAQRADALQKKAAIGYPLQYLLELDGLPPTEIERVMRMARDQASDPILSQIIKDATAANVNTGAASADPNAVPGA
jgi:hypothetical protein